MWKVQLKSMKGNIMEDIFVDTLILKNKNRFITKLYDFLTFIIRFVLKGFPQSCTAEKYFSRL